MKIENMHQAWKFLYQHVPKDFAHKFPGDFGWRRAKYFLKLLDNPQNKLKIIHIAGTSGKGSTAYLTSVLLKTQGFKVGLHTSPHLIDVRERCQIDNQMVSKKDFCMALTAIIPFIKKMEKSEFKGVSYFEILAGLAFKIFVEKKVDYAVIETGIGGWYDATNTVKRADKISIITEIGFDHTEVLGKTLAKIAFQKAMIIQPKSLVVSQEQKPTAKKIIEAVTKKQKAKIFFVNPKNIQEAEQGIGFNFQFRDRKIPDLKLNLNGGFQAKNASVALATVLLLSQRDGFNFDQEKVRKAFVKLSFPGRMEIFKLRNRIVVIDGAHNPPKMKAFTKGLKKTFPGKKFKFLVAFKKGKDYENTLRYLIPQAKKIIITDFFTNNQDYLHFSEKPETIGGVLKRLGFSNTEIIHNCKKAVKETLKKDGDLVITGSLYLLSEIYSLIKDNLE